jgi:acyl-CoA thioesterase-1
MAWLRVLALLAYAAMVSACTNPVQAQRPLTYVAIGASDAVGVGAKDPETEGWVPRLGAHLGPNTRVVNLGVSGSTLSQALQEQLGPAVDAQPDVVTLWLAVNDLNARVPLERYAAQLDALLEHLQEHTHARVYVGNVPDLARLAAYRGVDPGPLATEVGAWNQAISEITQRRGAILVDLYAHWHEVAEHPEYLSADGFHPSSEGYAALANVFADAIDARS